MLQFMYMFSYAMTTHTIKSFYWTSILNKLSVETFSEREYNETFHPPVLGRSVSFQRNQGSELWIPRVTGSWRCSLQRTFGGLSHTVYFCQPDQARYNLVPSYLEITHSLWAACSSLYYMSATAKMILPSLHIPFYQLQVARLLIDDSSAFSLSDKRSPAPSTSLHCYLRSSSLQPVISQYISGTRRIQIRLCFPYTASPVPNRGQ